MWLAAGTGCWYQASILYHMGFSTKLIEYLHNIMAGFPQSECDERGGGYILFMAQSQESHKHDFCSLEVSHYVQPAFKGMGIKQYILKGQMS